MKRKLFLPVLFMLIPIFSFGQCDELAPVIAVYDFNVRINGMPDSYGSGAANLTRSSIVENRAVKVIERSEIVSMLNQLKIPPGGIVDQETAIKVGRMLQAGYAVFGIIEQVFSDTIISARLVNVERGIIVSEFPIEYKSSSQISTLMKNLAQGILRDLNLTYFSIDDPTEADQKPTGHISSHGRHCLSNNSHVWLFIADGYGYYHQPPSVSLKPDGSWEHGNLNFGKGINQLVAVLVTDKGHELLNTKIDFGHMELPEGSVILTRVSWR